MLETNIFYSVSLLLLLSCQSNVTRVKTGYEGKAMPTFSILLADSSKLKMNNLNSGREAVFFFFGPHCPYSKAQMREIVNNIESLRDYDFYVFTNSTFQEMKQFYSEFDLYKYSNVKVGVDDSNFFAKYFAIEGVPFLAIYDKSNHLNTAYLGRIHFKELRQILRRQ